MSSEPHDTIAHPSAPSLVEAPPQTIGGILRRLGPGLIIAASIVGSGELIATTKTGAEAGFTLLWLILLGCVIKVFAQIEFGRYTITEGRTTIDGMNQVPGPRVRGVNWLVWYWLIMFCCSTSQLGGIVGVVGQSLAIPFPITGDMRAEYEAQKAYEIAAQRVRNELAAEQPNLSGDALEKAIREREGNPPRETMQSTRDDLYWSLLITIVTSVMLVVGRYGFVQNVATLLVAAFTAVTIGNVFALQTYPAWSISADDVLHGLSFRLPEGLAGTTPLATALAAFGIIGVGASEIIAYPYWCLEKGYARWTGPCDQSESWAARARGWLRVMRWDALCSMVIYTIATLAFYILGAAVLHRSGRTPTDQDLVPTLMDMYAPVFGEWARWIFLFGAFAVLYSTFFVASGANARIAADGIRTFRVGAQSDESRRWWTRLLCGLLPFISLGIYTWNKNPVTLVLISGVAQAVMLPMLGAAALYFRYQRCDRRITPTRLWDVMLWLSFVALLITGIWGAGSQALKLYNKFRPVEQVTSM
jgi:Mn2+/Fe2+ NRAMP family transporter